jgi:hypothetical protein
MAREEVFMGLFLCWASSGEPIERPKGEAPA